MNEDLTQALHCAAFMLEHLLAAGKGATAVESMVLLPLIGKASMQRAEIQQLIDARSSDAVVDASFAAPSPLHTPRRR